MLSLLTGAPLSATELSREPGISQALASYHLRQLHAAGVVELAEIRSRRGGRERRFTYRPPPSAPGPTGSDNESHALFAEAISVELRRRVCEAQRGAPRLGVDAELWVDAADRKATIEALRVASAELHERARPPRTPDTIRVSVTALLFAMTTPAS
jgi:DNA-binding transcriptional ArsR family regulator